jgi:phosphatidylglycerophosphate synthase
MTEINSDIIDTPSSDVADDDAKLADTELGQFWTVANVLSMLRLVLVIPVTYLILVDGSILWILSLLILALTTDYLDGRVARWSHSVSNWGKLLDPFADKAGGLLVISALTYVDKLPLWFFATVLGRDLLIILGGVIIRRRTGTIGMSILSGKLAVSAIALTVLFALLNADPDMMQFSLWFTTALLVFSYLRYLRRFFKMYATVGSTS